MTGRAAGYCAGYGMPGYVNPGGGRGAGFGFGRGRGWRNRFYATGLTGWQRAGWGVPAYAPAQTVSPEQETDMLKEQAKAMEENLKQINDRITQLQNQSS